MNIKTSQDLVKEAKDKITTLQAKEVKELLCCSQFDQNIEKRIKAEFMAQLLVLQRLTMVLLR